MNRAVILRSFVGLCHMLVCAVADATDEEILAVCNRENPSGTTNGWADVIRNGKNAPAVCEEHPERLHIFVGC